ncbi:hypothetical protein SAMN05720761_101210 [Fibrobacter sp. UWCM]|jgi:hypothetical protein|uniref:hypothetical protein n=1 Tax=unclassified Fibrobacter TaxID=2634177 RepID=UPI000920BB95|nr:MULTISPECIES: hypothetical protein [unclassified Fibrobacter]MBR4006794.1 hypothetical protein [Fibrobacter sp.]SHG34063.1 hypothetical protein SAMN05720761_101210 [Fibrobacter sp. UWCM]
MMNRVWKLGLAALGGAIVACSGGDSGVAGSSMETENSIALSVQLADGSPAARVRVIVRPDSYLAGADSLEDSLVDENMNFETDSTGKLILDNLGYGSYIVEARSDSLKGASKFNYRSWQTEGGRVSLHLGKPGLVSGRVLVEDDEDASEVTVAVQGLDYSVMADGMGNFEFKSLPAGYFEMVAFVQTDSVVVDDSGKKGKVRVIRKLGSSIANVRAGQESAVVIDTRPQDSLPSFVFEDFEGSIDAWKVQHSENANGSIEIVDAGLGREGKAAHFTCENDSNYNWVLMGRSLGGMVDMSNLDSIVFWARTDVVDSSKRKYISFSLDLNVDSTSSLKSGKAWVHLDVDTVWNRFVVTPSDFLEPDSNNIGGNLGWDVVKRNITDISIFGGTGGEFWIDDIEVFGYSKFVARDPE